MTTPASVPSQTSAGPSTADRAAPPGWVFLPIGSGLLVRVAWATGAAFLLWTATAWAMGWMS